MEKFIHQHLTDNYFLIIDDLFDLNGRRTAAGWLIKELQLIFNLDKRQQRRHVKSWWKKNRGKDFRGYWSMSSVTFMTSPLSAESANITITIKCSSSAKDRIDRQIKELY